jgi:hypothetical protein
VPLRDKENLLRRMCLILRQALARTGDDRELDERKSQESTMATAPLRFGIWALVHGPRAAHQDPEEPYDASWERNRDLILAAEELGYDSTLIAQHTINPHQEDLDQLEAWSAAAAIAALTKRIEIIAAIKPYLYHPVVLAKLALGIENISGGRFAINLVNAWNRPELEKAGISIMRASISTSRTMPCARPACIASVRPSMSAVSPSRRAASLQAMATSGLSMASRWRMWPG